ncbi:MAG: dihydrodipicolinate synthase family protein [Lachnospiraceae bacterium]|jgi:4-hydroxy-tetrahydrodipicolinate synthase|nr:dihydrodipicolinate synthase family protein [Lachnospiraceae bacterium]
MNPKFAGIYAVAITPFHKDGSFDFDKAKKHLDWLIENGVQGICLLGATGEYQSVTLEEHKAYVREIVPYIKGRVGVMVGATRERADDVIELVSNIKDCGGDAAMVLTPPYCHPAQDEIVENYRYIMEKTQFPIMLYNNPGSCGVNLERDTFQKLFQLPYAAVVKESSGSMQKVTEVLMDAPERISVFCGCDTLAYESFAAGACGWISMLANVAPKDCVALYDAVYCRKDLAEGWKIYRRLLPGLNLLENFPKPVQAMKYVVDRKTDNGGFSRRPRMELTDKEKNYVYAEMHADEIQ